MKKNALALAALLGFSASAAQAAIVIDDFNDPFAAPGQSVYTDGTPATDTLLATGLTGVLGGSRELSITCDSGCIDNSSSRNATLTVEAGELAWTNGTNVKSTAQVMWNANGAGLNADMLSMGNAIVATVLEADLGFNYTLTLWTSDTDYTSLISGTLFAVDPSAPEEAFYNLDWFELVDGDYVLGGLPFSIDNTGAGVDLTDVNKITFALTNTGTCYQSGLACSAAVDLRIDDATLRIPEPASVALLGLGLLGLAGMRMRKQA